MRIMKIFVEVSQFRDAIIKKCEDLFSFDSVSIEDADIVLHERVLNPLCSSMTKKPTSFLEA